MPDHRKEHRGHERHLEELAPELLAAEGVAQDQDAGRNDHEAEHEAGRPRLPDAEAVEEGQADPDEVEGIVSQLGQRAIARRFAAANANHAASTALGRSKPVAAMADGLDRSL